MGYKIDSTQWLVRSELSFKLKWYFETKSLLLLGFKKKTMIVFLTNRTVCAHLQARHFIRLFLMWLQHHPTPVFFAYFKSLAQKPSPPMIFKLVLYKRYECAAKDLLESPTRGFSDFCQVRPEIELEFAEHWKFRKICANIFKTIKNFFPDHVQKKNDHQCACIFSYFYLKR